LPAAFGCHDQYLFGGQPVTQLLFGLRSFLDVMAASRSVVMPGIGSSKAVDQLRSV
jgi:hypothetical protein